MQTLNISEIPFDPLLKPKRLKVWITAKNSFIAKNIMEQLDYDFISTTHKELDLLDTQAVDDFLKDKFFDVVIHTARVGGRRKEPDMEIDALENIVMFENLLINRHCFDILINIGSGAEIKPTTYYGSAKFHIAEYIERLDRMYNLRCWGVWGKYEAEDRFPTYCLTHKKVIIPEDKIMRYIHVDDLIKKMDWIIETRPIQKIYNLGEPMLLSAFAKQLNPNIKVIIKSKGKDYI